ncbi:MAG: hypothetical protein AB8B84_12000 [Granulosicoccus sp.]
MNTKINVFDHFGAIKPAALVATLLVLAGCSAVQPKPEQTLEAVAPIVSRPDGSVRGNTDFERVAQLWAAAEEARKNDQNTIALELLYDALEVSPQNALLWSRAAEIQLDTLEAALAESYATKSNAFALDNRPLLHRNWMIIEHARNMRGDLLGVRSAHKKVQEYQNQ